MNLNRPDMTETVKYKDYTNKSLQKNSTTTTMEVVTQTNAVKSPTDSPATTKLVYTVEEIARMLAISLRSAYNLCNSTTEFRVLRVGGSIRVPKDSFDAWLNRKSLIIGRIGKDLTMDEGKLAAQQVGLTMLATIQANIGSINKIKRVIKVLGMVNCTPDFGKHPYVINGCSELFAAVWGPDNGVGTRSAVGFGSLPDSIAVEIEALFELYE